MNKITLKMAATKKKIFDAILILAERFSRTDDSRIDEDYLADLVEDVRVSEILKEYNVTKIIDQNWLMDFGTIKLHKVNIADDPNIDFCECDIMKAEIPAIINLTSLGEGNLDLGLKVLSACGKTSYFARPLENWKLIPKEHVLSKFNYYQRFGNTIYVNKLVENLRFYGIPATTDGLKIKKTLPVTDIKLGVVYMVKGTGSITYNSITYLPGQTFTGVSGQTTFTGLANVYYNNYEADMTDKDPYPVSPHLARQIIISILTTELQIERQQVSDVVNDSVDDTVKVK